MSIIPNNIDPLQEYVSGGIYPPLTVDGLVYNKVYAQTGVIDVLSNTQKTGYTDPSTNVINGNNNSIVFGQNQETSWISSAQFGGPGSIPVVLTYNFNTTSYYNYVSLDVLNVPCFVELGYIINGNWNALPGASTFVINGGNNIYTQSDFLLLQYQAPSTQGSPNLSVRITRNQNVQSISNGIPTNIAYSVGVQNVTVRLQVLQSSDVPSGVLKNASGIITQNRLGFIENYSYQNYPVSNAFNTGTNYWKSAPQPTADSVVYFYAKINDTTATSINRLYIDPLYSTSRFNIYFTTNTTSGGLIDPDTFTWTPIQRDFILRKGLYDLPTVSATYLKFEFVQLVPEAYDLPIDSVTRTINVFPADVEDYYYQLESMILDGDSTQYSYIGNNINPQTATTTSLNASTLFGLSSNTVANANTWPSLSALNASQYGNSTTVALNTNSYIIDPTMSYKTIDNNGNYNGVAYNQFLQRRFPNARTHAYTQITLEQNWHEAYFTGIQYLTAFYEQQYDDIRSTPTNLYATNGTTSGFNSQNVNYVGLQPDDIATTSWYPTIDSFKSFNIGAITSDWNSFLSDSQVLMNSSSVLQNTYNCTASAVGNFGNSTIVSVQQLTHGTPYNIRSGSYQTSTNEISYTDANFLTLTSWSGLGGTTITGTLVSWASGTNNGTASGLSVSGGTYSAAYNFTIPGVVASGTTPWEVQLAVPAYGVVGLGSYVPSISGNSGAINYYFYTGVQVSGTAAGISNVNGSISGSTRFVNPTTGAAISGTTVTGTTANFVSGTSSNLGYVTSTNYTTSGYPSNTIQFVVSGSGTGAYDLYQLGVFPTPTTQWVSPQDRKYMRVSGVARIFLPFTDLGTYRISLFATSSTGVLTELVYKQFNPGYIPLNTWFDVELETFTGDNYTQFYVEVQQVNGTINEVFYVAMLSPFYHPVRFEYTTISGSTYPNNYQFITGPIGNSDYFVSTISGLPASGIQLRMTSLDPNIFISGVSVVPYYKQSPYYAELNIDYIGVSKTNEVSVRRAVENKPYFQNNTGIYPSRFGIPTVVGPNVGYVVG